MLAKEVKSAAMRLPRRERARLAQRLLVSLEEGNEAEIMDAWIKEAERRYRAYKEGRLKGRPAAEAIRDIRRRLAK